MIFRSLASHPRSSRFCTVAFPPGYVPSELVFAPMTKWVESVTDVIRSHSATAVAHPPVSPAMFTMSPATYPCGKLVVTVGELKLLEMFVTFTNGPYVFHSSP